MNTILKRKLSDTLSLNNISKKLKHTKQTPEIPENKHTKPIDKHLDKHLDKHNKNKNIPSKVYITSRKEPIPKRLREVVWNTYNGDKYSSKCHVAWCNNIINVFNYQVGHDIPESKGGSLDIENLKPICGNCNLSMGNKYTITEWSKLIPADSKHYIHNLVNTDKTDNTDSKQDARHDIGVCSNILEELQKNDSYMKINKTVKKINKMLEKKHLAGNTPLLDNTIKPLDTLQPTTQSLTPKSNNTEIEDESNTTPNTTFNKNNKTHESTKNVTVVALLLIALQMIIG